MKGKNWIKKQFLTSMKALVINQYTERSVHVDCQTQKRAVKDSALWYKRVMESNGALP